MFNFIFKKEIWLPVAALILIGGFIYAFNLHNGLFWDDDEWIINNIFVHDISWDNIKFWFGHNTLAGVGLKSNYYRPFLFFTFAVNYALAGVKPLVYHLTSNAIHIFNAILVFWLTRQIFSRPGLEVLEVQPQKSPRLNLGTLTAFLTALFFLVHPLQTEAVAYISGRGDVLAAMFMLLALVSFHKAETFPTSQVGKVRLAMWYRFFSFIFLILGLLSRETGIIFPLLALVFYITVISPGPNLKRDPSFVPAFAKGFRGQSKTMEGRQGWTFLRSIKQGLLKTWPYFAIVFVYGILRLTVLNFLNTLNFYAEPNLYSENWPIRLFTFLPILWEYLKLLLAPVGLHMERGGIIYTSLFQWPVWIVGLGLASLLWWLNRLYKKEITKKNQELGIRNYEAEKFPTHDSRFIIHDSSFRVWFLGVFWFFIALAPVSGITPINALMYEHWLYLPMVGFWLIVSYYLTKLFQGSTLDLQKGRTLILGRTLMLVALVVYLSFFGYQSIQRNILWGKPTEFYKDILKYEPQSARISNNLGNLYFNQGHKDQAETYYRQAVEAGDAFPQPYFNLGSILQSRGDIFGAIKLYEKAIEINPDFYYPYQNLAALYAQQGNLTKAVENIEKLKVLLPNNPRVFYNSALIYLALKNQKQAWADLQMGVEYAELDPETGRLMEELINKLESGIKN